MKPRPGWHKLNINGASLGNPSIAGIGGLIRDDQGRWFKGFTRSVGSATSVTAKLWALRDVLLWQKNIGIDSIEVEMDAVSVVLKVKNSDNSCSSLSP